MLRTALRTVEWVLVIVGVAFAWSFWPASLGGSTSYVRVDGHSMDPTLHDGDLAIVKRQSTYRLGDAVAYRIPKGEFGAGAIVIHRLIRGDGVHGFTTKGDNRSIADEWHPRTGDVLGRIRFDVPGGGDLLAKLTRPIYLGGLVAILTVIVMLIPSGDRRRPTGRRRQDKTAQAPVRPSADSVTPNELVPATTDLGPTNHVDGPLASDTYLSGSVKEPVHH